MHDAEGTRGRERGEGRGGERGDGGKGKEGRAHLPGNYRR